MIGVQASELDESWYRRASTRGEDREDLLDRLSVHMSRSGDRWIPYCCEFAKGVFNEECAQLNESLQRILVACGRSEGARCST